MDPPTTGPVEPDASDIPVTESDEELQEVDDSRISVEERRRKVQGGYPDTPKRQKYEDQRTGAPKVAQFVLNEILTSGPEGWLDPHALSGMSALTGKVVRGGRAHRQRRRSLFDCATHRNENRLSVLFFENGSCKFVDENAVRERKTFRQSWIGATFFYEDRPSGTEQREVHVDTLD